MKNKDVKKMKSEEANKKLSELKSELMILHGQSKTGTPPKNPGQIRAIRRTIAKIHTMNNSESKKQSTQKNLGNTKKEEK
ncbi:MAG: 50S ribosomal protein L29 [Candidatus Nanoarchaeia archaeon]